MSESIKATTVIQWVAWGPNGEVIIPISVPLEWIRSSASATEEE